MDCDGSSSYKMHHREPSKMRHHETLARRRRRGRLGVVAVSSALLIRRATPDQSARLTEIAHAAKRHWGYPERYIVAWKDELTLTPEFIADQRVYTVSVCGEVVACCALVIDGAQASIEHMWVLPAQIGTGIGRQLFEHVVAETRRAEVTELEIVSDPNAAGFYARIGAVKTGDYRSELEGRERILPIYTLRIR